MKTILHTILVIALGFSTLASAADLTEIIRMPSPIGHGPDFGQETIIREAGKRGSGREVRTTVVRGTQIVKGTEASAARLLERIITDRNLMEVLPPLPRGTSGGFESMMPEIKAELQRLRDQFPRGTKLRLNLEKILLGSDAEKAFIGNPSYLDGSAKGKNMVDSVASRFSPRLKGDFEKAFMQIRNLLGTEKEILEAFKNGTLKFSISADHELSQEKTKKVNEVLRKLEIRLDKNAFAHVMRDHVVKKEKYLFELKRLLRGDKFAEALRLSKELGIKIPGKAKLIATPIFGFATFVVGGGVIISPDFASAKELPVTDSSVPYTPVNYKSLTEIK